MNISIESILANLFFTYADYQKEIEQVKTELAKIQEFEPYAAFQRIDRLSTGFLGQEQIQIFLQTVYNRQINNPELDIILRFFDLDGDMQWDYKEFLTFVLPTMNPQLRESCINRDSYRVNPNELLPKEIEKLIAVLFSYEIEMLNELEKTRQQLTQISDFNPYSAFKLIAKKANFIDVQKLLLFISDRGFTITEQDIITLFQRIDKDKDNMITTAEFVEAILPYTTFARLSFNTKNQLIKDSQNTSTNHANNKSVCNSCIRKAKHKSQPPSVTKPEQYYSERYSTGDTNIFMPLKQNQLQPQRDYKNTLFINSPTDSPNNIFNKNSMSSRNQDYNYQRRNLSINNTQDSNYNILTSKQSSYCQSTKNGNFYRSQKNLVELPQFNQTNVESRSQQFIGNEQLPQQFNSLNSTKSCCHTPDNNNNILDLIKMNTKKCREYQQEANFSKNNSKTAKWITQREDYNQEQDCLPLNKYYRPKELNKQKNQKVDQQLDAKRQQEQQDNGNSLKQELAQQISEKRKSQILEQIQTLILYQRDIAHNLNSLLLNKNFRFLNFFQQMCKPEYEIIQEEQLEEGLNKLDIYLTADQLQILIEKLNCHSKGYITFTDFTEIFNPHLYYFGFKKSKKGSSDLIKYDYQTEDAQVIKQQFAIVFASILSFFQKCESLKSILKDIQQIDTEELIGFLTQNKETSILTSEVRQFIQKNNLYSFFV